MIKWIINLLTLREKEKVEEERERLIKAVFGDSPEGSIPLLLESPSSTALPRSFFDEEAIHVWERVDKFPSEETIGVLNKTTNNMFVFHKH